MNPSKSSRLVLVLLIVYYKNSIVKTLESLKENFDNSQFIRSTASHIPT